MTNTRNIDLQFMGWKRKWSKVTFGLHLFPIGLTVVLFAYMAHLYPQLPMEVPIHWNLVGEADRFAEKSWVSVLMPASLALLLNIFIAAISVGMFRTRTPIKLDSVSETKKNASKFLISLSVSLLLLNLILVFIFARISLAIAEPDALPVNFIWLLVVVIAIAIVIFMIAITHTAQKKSTDFKHEDQHWHWNLFYHNPEDAAVLVPKRVGVGWTINTGNLRGKLFVILPLLLVALIVGAAIIFL